MNKFLKFIIPAIIVGSAIAGTANAQVASPNFLRKVGNNVYPLTTSTILGTSTTNGAFNNLNVSGTCNGCGGLTSSSAVTSFNGSAGAVTGVGSLTGTANQVIVSTSTGNVTLSGPQSLATSSSPTFSALTVNGAISPQSIQGFVYFPSPAQLAGGAKCGSITGVTDVGACMNDIIAVAASGTIVDVGPYNYPSSTWTTMWNFNVNQTFVSVLCVPNVSTFNYGGNTTSTNWNYGSSASASGYPAHTYGVGFRPVLARL